jgi:electron transfer flavoprotein alpha/beta subunit
LKPREIADPQTGARMKLLVPVKRIVDEIAVEEAVRLKERGAAPEIVVAPCGPSAAGG